MIIRRRHTANFTVIGNALFDDERLAADEVGVMGFLLSRPNDWEVRRSALMRRWGFGRDGIRRVLTNLIKTGWCRVEKTRLSDGRFHIIYEIRDGAGPELSEEEVKRALSLVSSEAADAESSDSNAPAALEPPSHAIPPDTPQPGVADQGAAGRRWPIEGLPNTDDSNTETTQALWSGLRKKWPIGHMVSPFVCENLFAALTVEGRQAAFRGIDRFLSDCRTKGRKVCDLATYLRERRWEALGAEVPRAAMPIKGGTPQAYRWLEYRQARGEATAFMQDCWRTGKPWYAPTEWPPPLPKDDRRPFDKSSGEPSEPDHSPEKTNDISELADEMGR